MKSGKDIRGIVTEDPAEKEGKETITIEMTETRTVRRTISVTKEELALIRTGELPVWVQECCLGEASGGRGLSGHVFHAGTGERRAG